METVDGERLSLDQLSVRNWRYDTARQAGLTPVESAMFAESDRDLVLGHALFVAGERDPGPDLLGLELGHEQERTESACVCRRSFHRRAFLHLTCAIAAYMVRRMKLRVKCGPADLREVRQRRLLTQQEAARQVGVAPRTWQNWEAGTVVPRARHQRALLAWLEDAA